MSAVTLCFTWCCVDRWRQGVEWSRASVGTEGPLASSLEKKGQISRQCWSEDHRPGVTVWGQQPSFWDNRGVWVDGASSQFAVLAQKQRCGMEIHLTWPVVDPGSGKPTDAYL